LWVAQSGFDGKLWRLGRLAANIVLLNRNVGLCASVIWCRQKTYEEGATKVSAKVGFCTCFLLSTALAAVGQSRREDLKKRVSSDPDTSIAGCTALIQTGRESTASLVGTYYRRASAYMRKGDYDHAIQDYDDAIRLNPNDAPVCAARFLQKEAR
jgi:tetratricopeptide (TPR) repeat protein